MSHISVGLLGLGNVGSGVVKLLSDNAASFAARLGAGLELRRVAVRDAGKQRLVPVPSAILTTEAQAVCDDPEVRVVVELMGGTEPARELVLRAIAHGKQVVTANKHLLAEHGEEIFAAAAAAGVGIYYEAAVCGGLPIIRALREGLASDRIDEVVGIVNGTSNFILSAMTDQGRSFEEVLTEAQRQGFAEADPSFDVDGVDATHKLTILARLSFGASLAPSQVACEGIRTLSPADFASAARFGYVIKPLAIAEGHAEGVLARVHPALVPQRDLLARCSGAFNAVKVTSQALGESVYYGQGAGMMPTAVAVVSDLIEACRELLLARAAPSPPRPSAGAPVRRSPSCALRDIGDLVTRYYMRFTVHDQPGVLARIARVLGERAISIWQLVQEERRGEHASVVLVTHPARERDLQAALVAIDALPVTAGPTRILRIQG